MGNILEIRVYEELNDFLPPEKRKRAFQLGVKDGRSVRDILKTIGVPQERVDLVIINGRPATLDDRPRNGARISVYPEFESFDIGELARIRPRPLRRPRFVLDVHLGRLAKYLRMAGLDAVYRNDYDDKTLVRISRERKRTLLSGDRGLLNRKSVERGYCVREKNPRKQMGEILERFDLAGSIDPFTRCLVCNGSVKPVQKDSVADALPERVARNYDEFKKCSGCGKIYWKGTHYRRMKLLIDNAVKIRRQTG